MYLNLVERVVRVARNQTILAHQLPIKTAETTILRGRPACHARPVLRRGSFQAKEFAKEL
jgi:hypothetical protein